MICQKCGIYFDRRLGSCRVYCSTKCSLLVNKERANKRAQKLFGTNEYLLYKRKINSKNINLLTDGYVRFQLKRKGIKDITPEMIKEQRLILKIKRKIKQLTK